MILLPLAQNKAQGSQCCFYISKGYMAAKAAGRASLHTSAVFSKSTAQAISTLVKKTPAKARSKAQTPRCTTTPASPV